MTISASPPSGEETRAQIALRLGIALVLLVAAFMKAHQLATAPSLGEGLLHERWFNELVVLGELAFVVWLSVNWKIQFRELKTDNCPASHREDRKFSSLP